MTVPALTPKELLQKYNPVLVLLPQDFSRARPYRPWFSRSKVLRGDYHPCSAEFFLTYVWVRTDGPRPYAVGPAQDGALGLGELQKLIARSDPNATYEWEIDVAPIRSQKPGRAWPAYAEMVQNYSAPFEATAYARSVRYTDRIALQYWYLYAYNDAGNYHEGDWETVALELSSDGTPIRAGYSGHKGGFQRPWYRVDRWNGQPVVYVARGSHAAYFEHKKKGHRTKSLANPKGLPWLVDIVVRRIKKRLIDAIVLLRWNDHTPTHPDYPGDEPWDRGVFVSPRLVELPPLDEVTADGPFWWMRIQCRWGSSHSRLRGTAAPHPAFEQRPRYDDPVAWLDGLDPARG